MGYKGSPWPRRGEPVILCPVTGLLVSLSEARWRNGAWVHPKADLERGYKEPPDGSPIPHPLMLRQSKRPPERR